MRLNTATVESWVLNGKDYTSSKKKFFKALCRTHNFKVKLVFGNKVLDRGSVTFMENSGWIIAHIDSRFMFDSDVTASGLTISISNKENEIVNSQTDVEYIFGKNKCIDADLYFAVGTIYPYNQLKQDVPESLFRVSEYDCSNKLNFDSLPDAAGEDTSEDVVRIISDTFEVSNDVDVSGDTVTYNNRKTAYSVLEISKSDWQDLLDNNSFADNVQFVTAYESENWKDDLSAWLGVFAIVGEFPSLEPSSTVVAFLSGNFPNNDSGEMDEPPKCSFTTSDVSIIRLDMNAYTKLYSARAKTYIDGVENTDTTYVPCFDGDYPFAQETCTIEGAEPVTNSWLWESDNVTLKSSSDIVVRYRLALRDVSDEYRDAILNATFTGTNIYSTDYTYNIYVKSDSNENIAGTLLASNMNYAGKGSIKLYDTSKSVEHPVATLFAQMFEIIDGDYTEIDAPYEFNTDITLTFSKIEE